MTEYPFFYALLIVGYIWMINETVGSKARREWRAFGRRQRGKPRYEYLLRYHRLHRERGPFPNEKLLAQPEPEGES